MLRAIASQGYWLDPVEPAPLAQIYEHVFCGPHSIPGANCVGCRAPLQRILSLDARDPKLNLKDVKFSMLHLLYCWTCRHAPPVWRYGIHRDSSITVFESGAGGQVRHLADYPRHFAQHAVSLTPLTELEQGLLREWNANNGDREFLDNEYPGFFDLRHQLGGEPFLIQPPRSPECPLCHLPMAFVASIAGDGRSHDFFCNANGIQLLFYLCPSCAVVQADESCD